MQPKDLDNCLALWANLIGGTARLVNLSENHTFRIDLPDQKIAMVRVHRPGYHSEQAINSELVWMSALRAEAGLQTPVAVAGINGRCVQHINLPGNSTRMAVQFVFEAGREPVEGDNLAPMFKQLGALAARCHAHAQSWKVPDGFERLRWDQETILGSHAHWGDWRAAPGVGTTELSVLEQLSVVLTDHLKAYGTAQNRFGIIHADMRLANLLIDGDATKLIDFDDCGFSWFAYDFAAAISFFEDSPMVPQLKMAWLEGYSKFRHLSARDIEMLDALVMLRRMALLAWIGSHQETELAQSHAAHFGVGTCALAEKYLGDR